MTLRSLTTTTPTFKSRTAPQGTGFEKPSPLRRGLKTQFCSCGLGLQFPLGFLLGQRGPQGLGDREWGSTSGQRPRPRGTGLSAAYLHFHLRRSGHPWFRRPSAGSGSTWLGACRAEQVRVCRRARLHPQGGRAPGLRRAYTGIVSTCAGCAAGRPR